MKRKKERKKEEEREKWTERVERKISDLLIATTSVVQRHTTDHNEK